MTWPLTYKRKGTSIEGMIKQRIFPASHIFRMLSLGSTRFGMTPGGGGNAAVVGESAIAKENSYDH